METSHKIFHFGVAVLQLVKGCALFAFLFDGHKQGGLIAVLILTAVFAIAAAVFVVIICFNSRRLFVALAMGSQLLLFVMSIVAPFIIFDKEKEPAVAWAADGVIGPLIIIVLMIDRLRDE